MITSFKDSIYFNIKTEALKGQSEKIKDYGLEGEK